MDNISFRQAKNLQTSSITLDLLSNSEYQLIKQTVAQNPNTSTDTLRDLSNDKHLNVRIIVAQNSNTSIDTLEKLAHEDDWYLLCCIVGNLVNKYYDYINQEDAEKILNILKYISTKTNDESETIKINMANNSFMPDVILDILSKDNNPDIRYCVVNNYNTALDTLQSIVDNPNEIEHIKEIAQNIIDEY